MKFRLFLISVVAWFARLLPRRHGLVLANEVETMFPEGKKTFLADAAITTPYRLVKFGTDVNHIAVTTAATEIPLGITRDTPAAAEAELEVELLGSTKGTIMGVASGAITYGDMLTAATGGAVATLTGSGTFYIIGRALRTVADGAYVPFMPCFPTQRVV